MIKMFQTYCDDNDEVEFKFIHVFKWIETCEKCAEVRASLGKEKGVAFDPTMALPAAEKGCLAMGNKKAKLARDEAPVAERLQSRIEKCITGVATK
jgi:hypothetical protein